jgi:lipopolysaccharide export system protein LptA
MNLRKSVSLAGLATTAVLYAGLSFALDLSKASQEPIKIAADRAELNDKTGQSIYSGNVIITQGRSKLEAESVSVNSDKEGISGFIATGELVHLLQFDKESNTETHAYAKTISFNRDNNEIVLHKKAKLIQDNSSFQGEEIRYNTVKRIVTAESSKEDRVEIIFQPNKGTK